MNAVVIHQPNTFPRLKVLQKIAFGNVWVIYDDVQYVRREWQNRTKLRYLSDPERDFWLSIPVASNSYGSSLIYNVKTAIVDVERFSKRMYLVFKHTYGKSKHWKWIETYLNKVLSDIVPEMLLCEFNITTTNVLFEMLQIIVPQIRSSTLKLTGNKNTKLIKICQLLNYKLYVSGSGGKSYLDLNAFRNNDINVVWQNWDDEYYSNKYELLNWRNISFLDFVARYGPEELIMILHGKV